MPEANTVGLPGVGEFVLGVLPDRFQHPIPGLRPLLDQDERLFDQFGEEVENGCLV